jgi:hypothetical protein
LRGGPGNWLCSAYPQAGKRANAATTARCLTEVQLITECWSLLLALVRDEYAGKIQNELTEKLANSPSLSRNGRDTASRRRLTGAKK